ncbi:MotA/TolQ/ExbB proton channel family protein [Tautonia sociabilis]|uniref:MotA/TolQ/ExbB proton channel family protein n=2 Tax=Tautonia sociabilis TaxID=2080755 RepID=A0A432MK39_9BACT|nr:MotA/TolQ/ExbB proton channel family protein [Tautonia sociabilis]
MVTSTGPIGVVLLLMSFYLIALVAWMYFEYRRAVAIPERLTRDLGSLLMQRQYSAAFERVNGDDSFLGRVLAAGVRKLPGGQPAAIRAMQLVNDDVTMEMEHRTAYLATVGTLGPLIGLFGTVYGMIVAFRAMSSQGQPETTLLAGGISTALFATLMGIGVAIPAITFYAVFRNRIARLSLEVELAAESLLEQFAPGIRPPHPLAAGSGGGMPVQPSPPQVRTSLGGPKEE